MASSKSSKSSAPSDVMGFLNYYLVEKAPVQLPAGVKEVLVKFAPWAALVLGFFAAMGALAVFGIGAIATPAIVLGGGARVLGGVYLGAVLLAVTAVLYFMAFSGLKARKVSGWTLLFYIEVLYIINSLLSLQLFNVLVGGLIGLYFLFQIRSYYKK